MVQGQIFSKLLYSSMRQMEDCYRLHRARLNLTPVFLFQNNKFCLRLDCIFGFCWPLLIYVPFLLLQGSLTGKNVYLGEYLDVTCLSSTAVYIDFNDTMPKNAVQIPIRQLCLTGAKSSFLANH
jgi:hypothetical protein